MFHGTLVRPIISTINRIMLQGIFYIENCVFFIAETESFQTLKKVTKVKLQISVEKHQVLVSALIHDFADFMIHDFAYIIFCRMLIGGKMCQIRHDQFLTYTFMKYSGNTCKRSNSTTHPNLTLDSNRHVV